VIITYFKNVMTRSVYFITFCTIILISCTERAGRTERLPYAAYDLKFSAPATSWDEGIPLGNGIIGALIWEKDGKLRFSLDRADLWDLRPMENLDKPEWKYSWVKSQWENNTYSKVQEMFDIPYDRNPAPSKIPGAALEFETAFLGEIESVELKLKDALCEIRWKNGAVLNTYINAESPVGWFRFTGISPEMIPQLIAPAYTLAEEAEAENPVTGQDLRRLGYPAGSIVNNENFITYDQEGWGGFRYQVNVRWKERTNSLEGCWSISSQFPGDDLQTSAEVLTEKALNEGFSGQFDTHQRWWTDFWSQSDITIPDSVLNKQWYLEMYKLGAATGNGAPPVSLQAVWTADNGKLPPWKGDFHHDLNTQLSYWPTYSSNRLLQASSYTDWLIKNRAEFEKYTESYFDTEGLNVPGVTTLTGQPMGGWIQYSFGPTVSAWLGHHFYLQWRYSMDREFLEEKAYPWIRDVALFLEAISETGEDGFSRLPLSSSPEIFDNSKEAWFAEISNFDLGLIRWTFEKASELAGLLGKTEESEKWKIILSKWPMYDIDPETGFTYVKGMPYDHSHRHFSHLIAFHPLGLIDISKGAQDKKIIGATIETLDRVGPDWWCGYSYSWLGNIKARNFDGDGAAEALRIFAEDFCLQNSFHVNGDQSGKGRSKMTYRPFTLEGNFAFASGIQEMLIQSHTGIVRLFPAIPAGWKDAGFNNLRTEGAFLFSAGMKNGEVAEVNILCEKGGELRLFNPFIDDSFKSSTPYTHSENILSFRTEPGQKIRIVR
jgi:alpha-L-fucosidase 2